MSSGCHNSHPRGEDNCRSKLKERDVRSIRACSDGPTVLASRFDVHPTTVLRARRGETWKHLGDKQ